MSDISDASADDAIAAARAETRAAFENRAILYRLIFEEIAAEVGRERAAEIMKRAIRRRGEQTSVKYREAAEAGDLRLVGCIFCGDSACDGALFEPSIESWDGETLVLSMEACPLVDAWKAAGLPDTEIDLMCDIAAAIDTGTFEGAGLELTFLDRQGRPGSEKCLLRLRVPGR